MQALQLLKLASITLLYVQSRRLGEKVLDCFLANPVKGHDKLNHVYI